MVVERASARAAARFGDGMVNVHDRAVPLADVEQAWADAARTTDRIVAMGGSPAVRVRSADVQCVAVFEELGIPAADFGGDELDGDGLADVGGQAGGVLDVAVAVVRGGRHRS